MKFPLICPRSQPVDKGFGSGIDMALQSGFVLFLGSSKLCTAFSIVDLTSHVQSHICQVQRQAPCSGKFACLGNHPSLATRSAGEREQKYLRGDGPPKNKGDGKGKGKKAPKGCSDRTPSGQQICFRFKAKGEKCKAKKCKFAHVCGHAIQTSIRCMLARIGQGRMRQTARVLGGQEHPPDEGVGHPERYRRCDLTKPRVRNRWLKAIREGQYFALILTPPCSTFSRLRAVWANGRGPYPVRSRRFPRGFPWNGGARKRKAELGNSLADFSYEAMQT